MARKDSPQPTRWDRISRPEPQMDAQRRYRSANCWCYICGTSHWWKEGCHCSRCDDRHIYAEPHVKRSKPIHPIHHAKVDL